MWIREKWPLRIQFIIQLAFCILLVLNVYSPGDRRFLYILLTISILYFVREIIIFIRIGMN